MKNIMQRVVKHLYRATNSFSFNYYCGKDASLRSA